MPQFLTPPASRQSSETPDAELKELHITDPTPDLSKSLDAHLESYLHLLDKHQQLQSELASRLSLGFLSLAHANYTCPPGRRYGADYYDERMKATIRVALQPPSSMTEKDNITGLKQSPQIGSSPKQIFSIVPGTGCGEKQSDTSNINLSKSDEAVEQKHSDNDQDSGSKESTAKFEDSISIKTEPEADTELKPAKKETRASDPIRCIPKLASIVFDMQSAEKEILRLRRELGRQ
ncbi:hypothetical protein BJX99DRAFT_210871 [Aspergillus californicus]